MVTGAIDNFDCPHVSCVGRCGETLSSTKSQAQCSCDKDCVMFGDCCRDFYDVCSNIQSPPSFTYNHGHVSCLKVPTNTVANKVSKTGLVPSSILNWSQGRARSQVCGLDWYADLLNTFLFLLAPIQSGFQHVFGISACPRAYPEGNTTGVICGLMHSPFKRGELRYQNSFCETCWKDFLEDDAIVNYLRSQTRFCIPDLIGMCKEGTEFHALKGKWQLNAF